MSVAEKRITLGLAVLLCVIVGAVILLDSQMRFTPGPTYSQPETSKPDPVPAPPKARIEADRSKDNPPAAQPADPDPAPERVNSITGEDLDFIAARNLLIPVAGKTPSDLRDNFDQSRSEGRQHNALDIMASQGTPVLATADGAGTRLSTKVLVVE
jgi:murein DD-endopeptidase MepM/ murein hydrolase activator NlpD